MGNCIRNVLRRLQRRKCSDKNIILLIVGLDNAGKTSVLNCISGDVNQTVMPTMGFRTISLKYKSYTVKIYDIGGSMQIRSLWPKYYNGIHGVIYVVDASDISRLTENKLAFGELISHEYISGKPLLLLANKQDLNGAIDELDLVENLDVEHAVNTMKCPTRVEICSCAWKGDSLKDNTIGVTSGYKWLLDIIIKNYTALDSRFKGCQNTTTKRNIETQSSVSDISSKLSIHSNPFKPINELVLKKEQIEVSSSSPNGIVANGRRLKKMFTNRNKTAPLTTEQSVIENKDILGNVELNTRTLKTQQSEMLPPLLNSIRQYQYGDVNKLKSNRPHTAPESIQYFANTRTVINIPGHVAEY